MPDYLVKIGNDKGKTTRKLKILSSSVDDAEKEVEKMLETGEHLISISNNSFPFGYRAVRTGK